jgi:hypothetical protein
MRTLLPFALMTALAARPGHVTAGSNGHARAVRAATHSRARQVPRSVRAVVAELLRISRGGR